MLIHIRMSDTTLNLFYGSHIQMFSHYRCFTVQMEGLYIGSTPQQEERSIWKEISHYIKLIVAEFSLHTHSLLLPYFFLPSILSFRIISLWTKVTVSLELTILSIFLEFLLWTVKDFVLWVLWLIQDSWVIIFTYLPT